jgi:Carboxypeptidase regulatory-like domain
MNSHRLTTIRFDASILFASVVRASGPTASVPTTSSPRIGGLHVRNLRLTAVAATLLCLLALLSGIANAQSTSNIRGTVTDQQGSVVVGASVTLTNLADNTVRAQVTNSSGDYSFELLKPGDYKVEVAAQGFKKSTLAGVHALVAKSVGADVKLTVGAQSEEITVASEGDSVQVNTQDASLGNNFIARQIANLPMEARDVSALLTLQAGVTRDGFVAGARSDQSNITLDGVDINEQQSSQLNSNQVGNVGTGQQITANTPGPETGPVLRLNSDAIQEFRVTTLGTNATEGRSSGAQVNLVTKSGTNSFHGSLFEYHRNTIFTANDFFNNRSGVPRPKLLRNTFGGSAGGPIIKNKAYFFFSYEGRRDAAGQSVVRTVPLPSLGQGILRVVTDTGVKSLNTTQLNSIFRW